MPISICISLQKCLLITICSFLRLVFMLLNCKSCLYILDTSSLELFANIFSVNSLFTSLNGILWSTSFFGLMKSNLSFNCKQNCFFHFHFHCSFLGWRNKNNFHLLILYPETVLSQIISPGRSVCALCTRVSLGIFHRHDYFICKLSLLPFQSACLLFIFPAWAPVRISRATVSGNGEWASLSFCSPFHVSPRSVMTAVVFSEMLFIRLRTFSSIPSWFTVFIVKGWRKCFYLCLLRWSCGCCTLYY